MDIEEIIKRVRTGDTTALKKLIETYSPMLRKVCFNITHEDEDALNDLVQVAFIRAYYSLHQLRDASKFGEWVSAIAKNGVSGNLVGISINLCKSIQKELFINDTP